MRERYKKARYMSSQVIIILIIGVAVAACSSPYSAKVVDRGQPPSRKIQVPDVHYVNRGETLFSIAWRYGLDYRQLARHNGINPPYTIYPQQKIRLNLIARSAGTTVSAPKISTTATGSPKKVPTPKITPPALVNTPGRSEIKTPKKVPVSPPAVLVEAPQWRWPAEGLVLSAYAGNGGLNKGIDIAGNLGQPVFAAASGQIVYAGSGLRGYGKLLIIKHNETFLSAYAHNSHLLVKEGEMVKVGQKIADMGSSGTDRVKLHFEIRREGQPVDPIRYLPRR